MIALALLLATVTGNPPPASYTCNGTTTAYVTGFPYLSTSHLVITVTTGGVVSTLALTTDYTVSPSVAPSTGTVTLVAGSRCPNGSTLTISRNVPLTQPQSFRTGNYQGPVHEQAFDRLEMQMQRTVQQSAAASLTSLALTAPLPMSSGGTGVSNLNCGVGVVTGNGTNLLCTALSGLAPPGTTGVLLQNVTPGSVQTGHINISGTLALNGADSTTGGRISAPGIATGGVLYDYRGTLSANWYAHQFNAPTLSAFQYIAQFTHGTGTSIARIGVGATTNVGRLQLFGGTAEVSAASGAASLLLQGSGSSGSNPNVIIDTQGGSPAGPIIDFRQNTVSKASVSNTGVITSTGLTSTGPVSGTTGTFSSTLGVTGASTLTGGVTIGTSGTAISGSFRGTTTWNPGTLGACGAGPCATATTTITVTGAATGADCIAGVTSPAPLGGFPVQCIVTATNTCGLMIVNQSNVSQTFGSATFYCRVFNP